MKMDILGKSNVWFNKEQVKCALVGQDTDLIGLTCALPLSIVLISFY